ncbi:MAG: hypothetical protein WCG27_05015 [Pseudomonadota bacterium]
MKYLLCLSLFLTASAFAKQQPNDHIADLKLVKNINSYRHQRITSRACFSPDSSKVVSASTAGTIRLLDLKTGENQVIARSTDFFTVQFSPDGKKVLTSSNDGTARLIDLNNKNSEIIFQSRYWLYEARFSPDGSMVVVLPFTSKQAPASIKYLVSGKVEVLEDLSNNSENFQFSPDSSKLITLSKEGIVRLRDFKEDTNEIVPLKYKADQIQFSPDGTKLIIVADNSVRSRDLKNDKEEIIQRSDEIFKKKKGIIDTISLSADGRKLVTVADKQFVWFKDLESGKCKMIIQHADYIERVVISADSSKVLTASIDGTARLRNLNTGIEKILKHNSWVSDARFSPDGTKIVTTTFAGDVDIWDI